MVTYDVVSVLVSGKLLPLGPCSSIKEVEERFARYEVSPICVGIIATVNGQTVFNREYDNADKRIHDYYLRLKEAGAEDKITDWTRDRAESYWDEFVTTATREGWMTL
jgi:hypothetical protein